MHVWVPGGHGMLGSAVCRLLGREGIAHVATDRELDITDARALTAFADATPFTHVINCAAYTQVDRCEQHEAEAHAVNADGAGNIARAARARDATGLHVSTDYVFDGQGSAPYAEDAEVGPINAYGRTKLAGERAFAAALEDKHYIVRTSWLFGANGPSFVATMRRLREIRPRIVHGGHFASFGGTRYRQLIDAYIAARG